MNLAYADEPHVTCALCLRATERTGPARRPDAGSGEHQKPKKARSRKSLECRPDRRRQEAQLGRREPAREACVTQLRACRAGSEQAILIDHLTKGATLAELVAALKPWSESSVKSALYWDVAKVKGHGVRTETSDDGTQRYHLVLPEGVEAPLGHVELAAVNLATNKA